MKIAFALEYSLGHVTHADNLKQALKGFSNVEPLWFEIPYHETPLPKSSRFISPLLNNWTVRASLSARAGLAPWKNEASAAFFHTQAVSLLSRDFMRRTPSIISFDATPIQVDKMGVAYNHRSGGRLSEEIKKRIYQSAFSRAAGFVTWSEWAKSSLVNDYGADAESVSVIAPGIDLTKWSARKPSSSNSPVRVLFVGGDFIRKGGEDLLKAYRSARQAGARIELDLVTGSDIAAGDLEGVSVYRGLRPGDRKLLDLYASADLFCFPSCGDCSPLAIMEALACGLPVISTDVGAIPEMLGSGSCGVIAEPGDIGAFSEAIVGIASNFDLRAEMSLKARRIAERKFSSEKNYAALIELLRKHGSHK